MANLVGKRFGSYQMIAVLGEGGMAVVYHAQHISMKREVAIKVIKPDLADTDQFAKRFEREAQTIAALSHPHILKIFEYGQHKNTPFLAMELLTGGSLAGRLRQNPLPLDTAARFFNQICGALEYAHSQGVVHRDLKPQNVLLDASGNAVLTDFGLVKLLTDSGKSVLTQSGAQMGTPAYMSPEQWRADAIDPRADIYALGVLLYEMLTATPLFKSDSPFELMHKHLYAPPPLLSKARPDLPVPLEQVIRRMLAKDREERYPSVQAAQEAFQSAITPASTTALSVTIAFDDPATLTISPSQAAAQEQAALARLDSEQRAAQKASTPSSASRFIGTLPQDVGERYVGREKHVADITNLLVEKTRLVSIYGRGGVGKTALACKVLTDLQKQATMDGIVALSAANGTARLDRILTDFGRVLGGDHHVLLEGVSRDGQIPAAQKTTILLEKLREGRYALLLDNLETLQDPATGELTDPDLQAFFETVLEQGGALRVLITSREPLVLPRVLKTWERLIPLDEGLPVDEAVALLRAFDPDGAAGLRDALDDSLRQIAQKTGGYPRALEAVAGLLLDDPLLSLDDLLRDLSLLSGEITPIIVQQAIERLSPEAVRVMQALALFARPVNQTALDFLLAPFMDTAGLRNILARLVRAYFVSFNRATQQFSLHPIDRDYCYGQIPTTAEAFNRTALHTRAAEYYLRQRKPQSDWKTIDDLMPQLAEFEHRVSAGGYDEAARIVLSIDRDYLWDWGQRALLADLHGRLRGHISDERLTHQNLRRIAWLQWFINVDEARPIFEQLLDDARRLADRQFEADGLDDLAQCYRGKGQILEGFQYHQHALDIYREIGDRRGQAEALGGMGSCALFGAPEQAVIYLEEAADLQRELNNPHSLGFVLGSLGAAYHELGQFERALDYLHEEVTLARQTHNNANLGQGLSQLGIIYTYLGDEARALDYNKQALDTAVEMGGGRVTAQAGFWLALSLQTYGIVGRLAEGIQIARQIDAESVTGRLPARHALRGVTAVLLLLAGNIEEAYKGIVPLVKYPLPPNFKVLFGLIAVRAGDQNTAMTIFQEALDFTHMISPNLRPLVTRALALAGLAVIKGDPSQAHAAAECYRQARAITKAPGFWREQQLLVDALALAPSGEILASVRSALLE